MDVNTSVPEIISIPVSQVELVTDPIGSATNMTNILMKSSTILYIQQFSIWPDYG